jgi:hypothetical protein
VDAYAGELCVLQSVENLCHITQGSCFTFKNMKTERKKGQYFRKNILNIKTKGNVKCGGWGGGEAKHN